MGPWWGLIEASVPGCLGLRNSLIWFVPPERLDVPECFSSVAGVMAFVDLHAIGCLVAVPGEGWVGCQTTVHFFQHLLFEFLQGLLDNYLWCLGGALEGLELRSHLFFHLVDGTQGLV